MPSIPLTQSDIIFSIVGAAVLFAIYRLSSALIHMLITRTSEIKFNPDQHDDVLKNCYRTFPIDNFRFNGTTFNRGMTVRITTVKQTTHEGHFIGINKAEMVCLITDDSVIAQEIDAILEIQAI